jgi:cell division protein FtsB
VGAALLHDLVPLLLAVLGTGGIAGAIVALLKFRPEAGQITVVAAQGALVVQQGVLKDLQDENARLRQRIEALEKDMSRFYELTQENRTLRARVSSLERRLKDFENDHP